MKVIVKSSGKSEEVKEYILKKVLESIDEESGNL